MFRIVLFFSLLFALSSTGWTQTKGSWLRGTWTGTGHQIDDNSTWNMRLNIGAKSAQVVYPSLKCGGKWTLISRTSKRAKFREQIKYGAKNCALRGNVTAYRLRRQRIRFNYYYPGERKIGAYCILRKRIYHAKS